MLIPPAGTRPRRGVLAGWLAFLLPIAALVWIQLATGLWRWPSVGDQALMELGVLEASRGRQLLGLFSRFGWFHPGPAFFYLAAVPYVLLGRTYSAVALATLALNALAAVAATALLAHRAESRPALWTWVAGLCCWALWLHPYSLFNPWPPLIPVLLLVVLLLLAAAIGSGSRSCIPWALLVASLIVQSHVALVPVTVAIAAVTIAMATPARDGAEAEPRPRRLVAALVWAASFAVWIPPLLEQVVHSPGNLRRLAEFFTVPREHSLWTALVWAATGGVTVPSWVLADSSAPADAAGGSSTVAAVAAYAIQLVALTAGWFIARRRGRRFIAALCGLCAAAMLTVWVSAWSIRGPLLRYLLVWSHAVGLAGAAAIAGAFTSRRAAPARPSAAALVTVGAALALAVAQDFALVAGHPRFPAAGQALPAPVRLAAVVPIAPAGQRLIHAYMFSMPRDRPLALIEPVVAHLQVRGCRRPELHSDGLTGHPEAPWLIPWYLVELGKRFPEASGYAALPHVRGAARTAPAAPDCLVLLLDTERAGVWQARGCLLIVDRGPGLSICVCPSAAAAYATPLG
ncbi:MAG TPA: hypothetical protein VGC93_01635 [Thermoanaerobaculia bacterium]